MFEENKRPLVWCLCVRACRAERAQERESRSQVAGFLSMIEDLTATIATALAAEQ